MVKDRDTWRAAVHGAAKVKHDWVTEQQKSTFPSVQKNINLFSIILKKQIQGKS